MSVSYRSAIIAGLMVLLSETVVFANESERVVATAKVQIDDVVVTATRFPESELTQPGNVTVITRQEIERSIAKTVPDLLAGQSLFSVSDLFGNNAANTTIDLRGFGVTGGQNTLVLVDGRRVSDVDLSGVQWSSIPLAAIERIEILRGSGAVLYGEGAVAGVVNIITRSPTDDTNRVLVGASRGSLDTRELTLNAVIREGQAGLSLSALDYSSDGYRVNNENKNKNFHADARWDGEQNILSVKVGGDRQDVRLPGARLVDPATGTNELESDRRGTSTPLDYASRDSDFATIGLSRTNNFGDVDVEVGYRGKEQVSFFDFAGFPDYRETDLSVWSVTPRIRIPGVVAGRTNQIVFGVDYYSWDYELDLSNGPQNVATPINNIRADQQSYGYYLQDNLDLSDAMTMSIGWREEWQKIDANDTFDPAAPGAFFGSAAPAARQDLREYAYDLGFRADVANGWSAFAKRGRSFRLATVDEIYEFSPFPPGTREFQFLRPQTAVGNEIGMERRRNGQLFRAAIFQIDVTNEIHLDAYSNGIGNTNLPPSRRRGLELESVLTIGSLGLRATYAYTEAKFLEGVFAAIGNPVNIAGKTVPLVPQNKATLAIDWSVTERTLVGGAVRYVSDQFMDNDEPNDLGVKIPAFTVLDVKLTHQVNRWRLGLAINNLFGEQYFTYAVRSTGSSGRYNAYPLPERTATLFAEFQFGR